MFLRVCEGGAERSEGAGHQKQPRNVCSALDPSEGASFCQKRGQPLAFPEAVEDNPGFSRARENGLHNSFSAHFPLC